MASTENYDSIMQALGKKRKAYNNPTPIVLGVATAPPKTGTSQETTSSRGEVAVSTTNEFFHLENEAFDYQVLDTQTQSELKTKETELKNVFANAYTQMGKILKDAQTLLASHDKTAGIFESWYISLGFKKDSVYRLISRYDLLANCEDMQKELIEKMPLSLVYEISKPSCVESLRKKVFAGEVKTLKEFKDLQKEMSLSLPSEKSEKQLTKRDLQLKQARLLVLVNEFSRKSSFTLTDQETFALLSDLFNRAEKSLNKINRLLE